MPVVIVGLALAQVGLLLLARKRLVGRPFSLNAAIFVAAALTASGAALWFVYDRAGMTLEREPALLWAWTALSAMAVGGVAAGRMRRMPAWEMFLGCLVLLDGVTALVLYGPGDHGLTSAPLRALLIAPAVLAACTYFGASIGFLFFASGKRGLKVDYEAAIGRRFLLSKSSATVSIVTTISVLGVGFGVNLVIIGLSILSGFEDDLRTKIIGANAHATIESARGEPVKLTSELLDAVDATPGVVAAAPYVQGEVAVASSANFTGSTVLVGIDPHRSQKVLEVLSQFGPGRGSIEALQLAVDAKNRDVNENPDFAPPSRTAGIVIGIEMANSLQLKIGDRMRVLSPFLEVLTPVGVAPKSVGLQVVGIFSSKMYEYDAHLAFVSLDEARSFFEIGDDEVTGIQLLTADPERSDLIGGEAVKRAETLAKDLTLVDWKTRNQTLFAALKLERVIAFIVLAFLILVASFSIVNTLTMSVIEKKREIAILKTMGADDSSIMKIFITQGLLVGGFGIGFGLLAVPASLSLLRKMWLPNDVYYIDALPVHLEGSDVVLVAVSALLIVWNFAVFPALRGSALTPVEGLRDG